MKNYILDKDLASRKIERMALEIAERNTDTDHILLAGIYENGCIIAAKLLPLLQQSLPVPLAVRPYTWIKKIRRNNGNAGN